MSYNMYAIKYGRYNDGTVVRNKIISDWYEVKKVTRGVMDAKFKGFNDPKKAKEYLNEDTTNTNNSKLKEDKVQVYVDGSYQNGNPGWGVYIRRRTGQPDIKACGKAGTSKGNNVAGELSAAMRAIKWANDNNMQIELVYDYEGIEAWATGYWNAKSPVSKKYKKYVKDKLDLISFSKVRAHSGNTGNIKADMLAEKGANGEEINFQEVQSDDRRI